MHQLPRWYPFSISKGGRPANLLVNSMGSEWGQLLFGKTLVRSLAQPIWKVRNVLRKPFKRMIMHIAAAWSCYLTARGMYRSTTTHMVTQIWKCGVLSLDVL